MNQKLMNRIFGSLSFLIALITYALTIQPSVPFWDCGEFSGAAVWQQVPHPPGAPLFLMIGKLFQLIIPFGDIGWRINMASVVCGAFSIMLLYLITVKVIFNFRKKENLTLGEYLAVYGSAFVGALAFTFSDTFWFNSVESEVYAASQCVVSIIVYLMMVWNEKADKPGNERYLLLIAYIVGLSTGIHLLAILTIFSIGLIVYFRKYKFTTKSFIIMGIITVIIFFVIYPGVILWLPALLAGHFPFKNAIGEYNVEGSWIPWLTIIGLLCICWLFYYGYKHNKPILKLATLGFLMVIFGYTTYSQILIRTFANGPMNENEPKSFNELTSYLSREQYGEQKMWPRRTDYQDDQKVQNYESRDADGNYIYGEWYPPVPVTVEGKDGVYNVPEFEDVNTSGELKYMFKYQINHMYIRYFLWNFVGRASDVQDASYTFIDKSQSDILNFKNGYADQFPVRFFALPLLFGLFGLFFHFWKDPKMAFVYLIMFLLMGVLATLQQNQQDPQPRERDYFYTGSFFVFCMWIGMGVFGLIEELVKKKEKSFAVVAIVIVSLILVPLNMAKGGWKIHSRAGNYLPFDYSYNLLQSLDKDAILFTNGDNDTFPAWWLQDVAGVRRDVRIVNLSLGNTLWYIRQLKHREPWGAKKIPLSFPDNQIMCSERDPQALHYDSGPAELVTIPVNKNILRQYTDDEEYINGGQMSFTYVGRKNSNGGNGEEPTYLYMVQNKLVKDIVQQLKFERPVYFSVTAGSSVYVGLDRFLRAEGMAFRICPVPVELMKTGKSSEEINDKCLLTGVDNTDNFSKTQRYGFKFRNLNNPKVYYDEVHRNLMGSYRSVYFNYAIYLMDSKKDNAKVIRVLDKMNENISPKLFPLYQDEELQLAMLYNKAGAKDKARVFAQAAITTCNEIINNPSLRDDRRRYRIPGMFDEIVGQHGTFKSVAEAYTILGRYDEAKTSLKKLYQYVQQGLNDQNFAEYRNYLSNNLYDIAAQMYNIDNTHLTALVESGKKAEAKRLAADITKAYSNSKDPVFTELAKAIQQRIVALLNPNAAMQQLPDSAANSQPQEMSL